MNLIITDYCMPGMTGYELLKKVKVKQKSIFAAKIPLFLPFLLFFSLSPYLFIFSPSKQQSTILKEVPVVIMSSETSQLESTSNSPTMTAVFIFLPVHGYGCSCCLLYIYYCVY